VPRDTQRAASVWVRFAEVFGAESLTRKFGKVPPPIWVSELDRLKDFEVDRGMRRITRYGKAYVPTLPEFLKLCREVANDEFSEEQRPTALRIEGPQPDHWDRLGQQHLLAYILRSVHAGSHCSCEETRAGRDLKTQAPTAKSRALTMPLVRAKNYWVTVMRELEQDGSVPADHGRAAWDEVMANAEREIAEIRAPE
jgi:hypothetical protein